MMDVLLRDADPVTISTLAAIAASLGMSRNDYFLLVLDEAARSYIDLRKKIVDMAVQDRIDHQERKEAN